MDKSDLTDQDIYCIARIIQSAIFGDNMMHGCQYCRYLKECVNSLAVGGCMHIDDVRKKLGEITKLDLRYRYNPNDLAGKFADSALEGKRSFI